MCCLLPALLTSMSIALAADGAAIAAGQRLSSSELLPLPAYDTGSGVPGPAGMFTTPNTAVTLSQHGGDLSRPAASAPEVRSLRSFRKDSGRSTISTTMRAAQLPTL